MFKIAIIQFPGTNCEYESFRAVKKAGLNPEFFRWNADKEELKKFDGYFIPGGFSHGDDLGAGRGQAVLASGASMQTAFRASRATVEVNPEALAGLATTLDAEVACAGISRCISSPSFYINIRKESCRC